MVSIPKPKKPQPSTKNDALRSEPTWDSYKDAREHKDAGKYPNQHIFKTRSGHVLEYDDSNGAEHITLQHRTGSMIQMMPDGAVQIVSHNGQYNIVFGENRMVVTGAHDLTVRGTASMLVDGDYHTTVRGLMSLDVEGSLNISAKDFNQVIRGNIDIQAKNMTAKFEGNAEMTTQGNFMVAGYGDMMMGSLGGSVGIGASGIVGIRSVRSEVAIQGQSDISIKSDGGKILQQASSDISTKSGGSIKIQATGGVVDVLNSSGEINMDAPAGINFNSGLANGADDAKAAGDITEAKAGPKPTPNPPPPPHPEAKT